MENKPKTLIIGGVAGGASCAARLRRINENAEIIILERGPYVSFANCGLPYRVGGIIKADDDLLLASPELFKNRFNIEVRTENEVISIDSDNNSVTILNHADQSQYTETYDNLVLSPGAAPIRPPLDGIDHPSIFSIRSIPDIQKLRTWTTNHKAKTAVVVGGGFIGLEMAENLHHLGIEVTLVEMLDQIMPPIDKEMTKPLENYLVEKGINLVLGDGVAKFVETEGKLHVHTQSGAHYPADITILAIGVKPETSLARNANIDLGPLGGIKVDPQMRTSKANIYAVGDAVEVINTQTNSPMLLALAGPANRQGRVAADAINGKDSTFRGVQATSICGVFDWALGSTGLSEKALQRNNDTDYDVVYLHAAHHVTYYPGAEMLYIKLIYRKSTGLVLGAQVSGKQDVARKIDVIATHIQHNATVFDLEEAELAYAPQFGAAKDAVNLVGMLAANALRGDHRPISPTTPIPTDITLLDVREPAEWNRGHLENAIHIPLGKLRENAIASLPNDKPLWIYCHAGKRGYDAQRMLSQLGFDAYNMSGGWLSWGK